MVVTLSVWLKIWIMGKKNHINYLNDRLLIVNTDPPTEGKKRAICDLIDLAIELGFSDVKTESDKDYLIKIDEFRERADRAYRKMSDDLNQRSFANR